MIGSTQDAGWQPVFPDRLRGIIAMGRVIATLNLWLAFVGVAPAQTAIPDQQLSFFENRIRPLLVRHCYECHSAASDDLKGGLRLDYRDGVRQGGDSGPAVRPGKPDESLLLSAVKHEGLEMPPGRKISQAEIHDLTDWIAQGAPDPRNTAPDVKAVASETFEALYQSRKDWWSLQPLRHSEVPALLDRPELSEIDRFIVSGLRQHGLDLAPAADRRTLARRACFAILGLPPTEDQLSEFLGDTHSNAWKGFVDRLLSSPHFGERWARHWMDVVRYTDTYGYEWDMPAKGAWRFRDYLIRAFNQDVPFDQLVREQIAGDLLDSPRLDESLKINESRIGPMFYQMGEKRHGDSAEFNGIHQEMLDNKIDVFGKAFLATTISCARCHDHKLDAVSQQDYYALGGLFMSARWVTNTVDLPERHAHVLEELESLKQQLRPFLAERWQRDLAAISVDALNTLNAGNADRPLEDPLHIWALLQAGIVAGGTVADLWNGLQQKYQDEHQRRTSENAGHFATVADFRDGVPSGWSVDGTGLRHVAKRGDFVVALAGESMVESILLGGLCSNTLSPRMNGAVRTPRTKTLGPGQLSFEVAGGDFSARRIVVDNAFLTERQQYLSNPLPVWQAIDGLASQQDRSVYIEYATKTSNPNFPPRVGLGGACSEDQAADPKSWFQLVRVVRHVAPFSPHDELSRFLPWFEGETPDSLEAAAARFRTVCLAAVSAWSVEQATDDHVRLLNWMLANGVLKNDLASGGEESPLQTLVTRYREIEETLEVPATVNGMVDADPALDYRLNIRGDYDQLGDPVPHGPIRLLTELCGDADDSPEKKQAGDAQVFSVHDRRELAELVANPANPLTARVYVNRVWHWLFGRGLVLTADDFGHAGEQPSHPELLDYLSRRFVAEGWSTKQLIRSILLTRTWQQSQAAVAAATDADPANRLLHHFPVRRLEAESIRDAMLAVSGRLDLTMFGPTTNPHRLNEDPQKRLFSGPLDGLGRRSIYTKVTIMEPPRFLATFNQPAPKIPTGRRDVTNSPAQSLTLLNDPFVTDQAGVWAEQLITRSDPDPASRLQHMFLKALGREASPAELARWVQAAAELDAPGASDSERLSRKALWQTLAHAMFNTKEFLYVR